MLLGFVIEQSFFVKSFFHVCWCFKGQKSIVSEKKCFSNGAAPKGPGLWIEKTIKIPIYFSPWGNHGTARTYIIYSTIDLGNRKPVFGNSTYHYPLPIFLLVFLQGCLLSKTILEKLFGHNFCLISTTHPGLMTPNKISYIICKLCVIFVSESQLCTTLFCTI